MCLHTEMTEAKNASFQRLLQIIIAHAFNAAGGILVNPLAIWQNIALALFIGHIVSPSNVVSFDRAMRLHAGADIILLSRISS